MEILVTQGQLIHCLVREKEGKVFVRIKKKMSL